jgi:hypothetical protein
LLSEEFDFDQVSDEDSQIGFEVSPLQHSTAPRLLTNKGLKNNKQ